MNDIPIIYQNPEIFIINKKAGMPVQGGEKIAHPLDEELAKQTGQKVYLVHRLDKDTSGLMIVAKTPVAASKWTKLIGSKEVKKEYIAVCTGVMNPKKGEISEDIIQHGQSRHAVTHYQVEKEWQIEREDEPPIQMCQIRLQLETGRMHQIRIHLAKQGCPIAGDDQHGNFKINKILRKAAGIKHLQLFSVKLTLPIDGKISVFAIETEAGVAGGV
ncbi:MAG: RNA pseudouridine synthase [Treponema sp.]|nr:RNA pseudouridine synthase [Treponema sp.]